MKVLPTSKALTAQKASEQAAAHCHSHHLHEKSHWSGLQLPNVPDADVATEHLR